MKVRAVLHLKGLAYQKLHALSHIPALRRRGLGKVPLLEIDGEALADSTDIVRALDRRVPDPPLFPKDPAQAALCHALEDWADESLYFAGLYHHWVEPAGRKQAAAYFRRSLIGRLAFLPFHARVVRQLRGQGTGRKPPEHVRADLERNLDAIEAMLQGKPFLLEGGPWLCDVAVAAQLAYLRLAPATANILDARPACAAFVERVAVATNGEIVRAPKRG